jgi:endonuclease-3
MALSSRPKELLPRLESTKEARAWAMEVHMRLLKEHGQADLSPRREPMHELISTMLSHRTNGANEDLAYARMRERFPTWEEVRDAPTSELAEAIAPSNFAQAKAPNIQKVLARIIEERGEADISFLRDLPDEEALQWLVSLPGVGLKTATLVLLFCFHKPVIPVDTHLHRVCGRVGLIGSKDSPERAHAILLSLLPREAGVLYPFHIAMLRHGQKICIWKGPRCHRCPLADICNYAREHGKAHPVES